MNMKGISMVFRIWIRLVDIPRMMLWLAPDTTSLQQHIMCKIGKRFELHRLEEPRPLVHINAAVQQCTAQDVLLVPLLR